MIYVILGIIILVVSFVVALISLVYEQRKVEELKSEEGEDLPSDLKSENEPLNMQDSLPVQEETKAATKPFEKDENDNGSVWWNRLETGGVAAKAETTFDDKDEATINAIREELSRLVLDKGKQISQTESKAEGTVDRNMVKRQRVLAGEFSLGDIRRGN